MMLINKEDKNNLSFDLPTALVSYNEKVSLNIHNSVLQIVRTTTRKRATQSE